ncbi:MAG: sigma factor-like helix-turn-helix DNA-binding protein [Herminiimonas sp.]|uniref:sigma factor-like helix-turn-helix DNA-binding protein n=1 Tax=Herminiimonas sp. TaxID=1926289 RepID=UPI002727C886|nr:sigma factor-like helix-turn-helix DNA-binding protein [Herminiimonas sp.]MDO9419266.1 sigma factor-like helix-turn-helix DNA-binding protein [Herminiimonas sp.]
MRSAELGEALDHIFSCLSPVERLVLILHEVLDCEHAEIATMLGKKTENTRQYLARARRRLRVDNSLESPDEKLCRDLIARFQAALNGRDIPAMIMLLADDQPVFVHKPTQLRIRTHACANDACFELELAA